MGSVSICLIAGTVQQLQKRNHKMACTALQWLQKASPTKYTTAGLAQREAHLTSLFWKNPNAFFSKLKVTGACIPQRRENYQSHVNVRRTSTGKEFWGICCLNVPWFLTDQRAEEDKKGVGLRRQEKRKVQIKEKNKLF